MQKSISHPLLRLQSSKFKISDWVLSFFPKHKIYVEPFGGCASVLLNKAPSDIEVYNDLNRDLYNLFSILRDPEKAQSLILAIEHTPFSRQEFKMAFRNTKNNIEKARRLFIRSQLGCFEDNKHIDLQSGSLISNLESWNQQPKVIDYASKRLKNTIVENKDALEIIDLYDSEDTLFFIDYPFPSENISCSEIDLINKLICIKGKVILCGWDNALYHDLLNGWVKKKRVQPGRTRSECIWVCPKTKQFDLFEGLTPSIRIV
ncbi:DNA adenine methylase [Acinetobacter indicus]|uniref:DNA adenine methylase n=1 Tax=Acinetobacter TaxID=469 RepID=UPI0015D1CECC|nr:MULTISPECIES: DNA adenine methylase [Acinetobacter]MCP0917775.1 DNA adenine methylase [Acinetobacter indicus]